MAEAAKNKGLLMYDGKPLIRKGNTIYYGRMSDKYIVMLQVMGAEQQNGIDVSKKVGIYLQYTSENVRPSERVVRKSEKDGLYTAMDFASIWLKRALDGKM